MPARTVERASRNDLLQRHFTTRAAEAQVGAALVLELQGALGLDRLRDALAERVRGVPRLRQRLTPTPLLCGRPVWVDDPRFDIQAHVHEQACPAPGDERALLDLAARVVATPLPAQRPLWSATLVSGLQGRQAALVFTFDHVLADGIGGLAVLERFLDGGEPAIARPFPQPPPTRGALARDATRTRLTSLGGAHRGVRRLVGGGRQLRATAATRAPATSLNRPTGPSRRLAVARAELAAVRDAAHAYGGTVNDVVLAAATGALHTYLTARGEHCDELVVSVLVAGGRGREADMVRNDTSVVPLRLPAGERRDPRLAEVTRRTRLVKATARGASAVLLEPAVALLARVGAVRWIINRQRRVNVFATNLRGPPQPREILGARIIEIIPVSAVAGNVSVAFAVMSYAGELTVTVVADPSVCDDVVELAEALQDEFEAYAPRCGTTPR